MDVFIMVRRAKTSIFLDVKETTQVLELKRMIGGILKKSPAEQRLYFKEDQLEDGRQLNEYGLNANTAKAQNPATVGLALDMEALDITQLSLPPELPDVMKTQEGTANIGTPAAPAE